jgi:aminoglycoside 6'-N-acetyltransferase
MIYFNPLNEHHIELLYHWFQEPTINQLYACSETWSLNDINRKYLPRIQGKENIPSFIVYLHDQPIGFIQYYCLTEHFPEGIQDDNPLFRHYSANKIAGIDMFIAKSQHRGKGIGEKIINKFIATFLMSYYLIVVDPERNNTQAIKCYIKAGFEKSDFSVNEHHLLLTRLIDK